VILSVLFVFEEPKLDTFLKYIHILNITLHIYESRIYLFMKI